MEDMYDFLRFLHTVYLVPDLAGFGELSWPQGEGNSSPNRSGVPEVAGGLSERFLNYLRFF